MNRIFHARIAWYQYLFIIVLGVNVFGALWTKHIWLAMILALMLIVIIEQVIHTSYTLTSEGLLELSSGRFTKKKVIPIHQILSIKQHTSMKFGRFSVTRYVLIEYNIPHKYVSVMPANEQEFIDLIEKRLKENIN